MKKYLQLLLIFVLFAQISFSQTYNPSQHTVSNKPYGLAQAGPLDARSYLYDASLFKYRPYQSAAEVLSYLNQAKYRTGNFPIFVNSGGTLLSGTFTGGSIIEYWFKDGTTDADLVVKQNGGNGPINANDYFDDGGSAKTATAFRSIIDNVISGLYDPYTGEALMYKKVTAYADGSTMTDAKIDGVIYRKKGTEYFRRIFSGITPEMFGAKGDAITNDAPAHQLMWNQVIKQKITNIQLGSRYGAVYRFMNAVNIDFTGKGQLFNSFTVEGNNCKIFINPVPGNYGYTALNLSCDDVIHYTSFVFKNIYFYTDNATRPNALTFVHAYGVELDNITIKDAATGIYSYLAADMKITHCNIVGCLSGVILDRMRDTYVIGGTHINTCNYGLQVRGKNSAEIDGNVNIDHIVVNQCAVVNVYMVGQYAPVINNLETELAGVANLIMRSNNYVTLSNLTSGPGTVEIGVNTPDNTWSADYGYGATNDFWKVSNIQTQVKVKLTSLFNCTFVGWNHSNYGNQDGNASIVFDNCFDVTLQALITKVSANPIQGDVVNYSVALNQNCSQFTVNGLNSDLPIKLRGTVATRGGIHDFYGMKINSNPAIVTDDNPIAFKNNENFRYILLNDANKPMISIVNGVNTAQ